MICIFMGVCGCGKSTVGERFADTVGGVFIEGDTLHPAENVARMSAGIPLTDADRAGWLTRLNDAIAAARETADIVCASCSALKKRYRDQLRGDGETVFVYLRGSREVLQRRMDARVGHFMPPTLLASQLETLEEPDPRTENAVVLDIDASPEQLVAELRTRLGLDRAG